MNNETNNSEKNYVETNIIQEDVSRISANEYHEEYEKSNKTRKTVTIALVIMMMLSIMGVSYSVWRYTFAGNVNKITTGDISLSLLEGENAIALTNALPMSDNQGKALANDFKFSVTSSSPRSGRMIYTIKILKTSVQSGYTAMSDNQIKVYLTNTAGTVLVAPTLISNLSNYNLYTKTDVHSASNSTITTNYVLRAWVDANVDASSWTAGTKNQYKFKIQVNESAEL